MAHSTILKLLSVCLALCFSSSISAPVIYDGTTALSKRASDLDDLWRSIPSGQKAQGDSAKYFKIDRTVSNAWGITYLYGCAGILISDPDFVIVAHLQEVGSGDQSKCQLGDIDVVNKFIEDKLSVATSEHEATPDTRIDFIYGASQRGDAPAGIQAFKDHFIDFFEATENQIHNWVYSGGSGTGDSPGTPYGKAVVQWIKGDTAPEGTLKVFYNQETPIRNDVFA
ncbi:hypothetical protein K431DRAFT_342907 [Polychaeton citri CBS 116435]|uniref:Uncharacterized protein n=1 Tax=Polychaeton citri CBS 116435 TaxID=1314669 RepID=A0A9P4UU63_9PEZI|nr:hypothetical protein K431DRAFT_342907 [Polychaeton citri CBS 116435]